ncbi:Sugar transporter [Colletotrichum higginsianum IMI 349063]|uniref:Sugar transporter n=3 Tax=Colletotrichum destructivum species complex TaxID=2707350 RepID=A0A1B7YSS0_COLHI|nr:Sugar transporter [Colletotrichum higginsianum IMI 349063]OBR15004.1 Sugar transporter [Colletotrichum higginsianum IMI 349063]TID04203.1 Quinate permease [Colletotrichum higginsianum]WQF77364.1 Putative major facilitator, sugar transporter, major facilitator superfamily [Colletotrichum destructivum]
MAPTGKRVYNWYISLMAAMCMVLYGYDASVFNSLQGSQNWLAWVDVDLKRDTQLIGLVNTAYTIGAIVAGFFIGGPIADYLGRRWGMAIGCMVTIVATLMQTFTPHHKIGVFIAGRVIIGLGQGMALTAGPVYIGEVAPSEIRGHIMACWQMFYSVGSFIAYWINYACSKRRAQLGEWDWRMVVIFQMLVPIIIIIALPFQPESPRWYIQKNDNVEAARAALMRIRDTEQEVEEELLQIREAIEYEKEAISSSYSALFKDPSVRKRLYLAFALNVGQQLTGQGTLNSYSTAIYKKVWPSNDTINLINALNATMGIFFTLNAMWTADRFGRRWLFMVGAAGMAVCMLIVPIVGMKTPTAADGTKSEPVGIAIVFLLFLFIFFYKPTWGATTWMWTAEIFSVNVRAQAVGMCSQMQNVANTIFQQFFPTFLANEGLNCLFFFMAMNLVLGVFVYFCIPETKQIPLEQMDRLFGGADHTEKGGQMLGVAGHDGAHDAHDRAPGSKDGAEVQQSERRQVV